MRILSKKERPELISNKLFKFDVFMNINKKTSQNAADLVSLEYELFFKYLRVSPSFQLAHAIRRGEKSKSSAKGVMHLSQVMKIYDIVGDVFNTNFPAWWETKGHLLFSGKEFINLSIKLDLKKDKRSELARIKNIIDNQYEKYFRQDPFLQLQKNKIRFQTLEDRMHLLEAKACDFIYDSPKSPGWRLLDIAEVINTKHSLRYRVKKTTLNTYERSYLTMLSSRHLNEALLLAENAALGKFPCFDKKRCAKFSSAIFCIPCLKIFSTSGINNKGAIKLSFSSPENSNLI